MHGAEIAVSLAREGREVSLFCEDDASEVGAAPYITLTRLGVLRQYLEEEKERLRVLGKARVTAIDEGCLRFVEHGGRERDAAVDSVLVATARRPNHGLATALRGHVRDLYEVGDCRNPRRIFDAIHQATAVAWEL